MHRLNFIPWNEFFGSLVKIILVENEKLNSVLLMKYLKGAWNKLSVLNSIILKPVPKVPREEIFFKT